MYNIKEKKKLYNFVLYAVVVCLRLVFFVVFVKILFVWDCSCIKASRDIVGNNVNKKKGLHKILR